MLFPRWFRGFAAPLLSAVVPLFALLLTAAPKAAARYLPYGYSSIVIEAVSGRVLSQDNPDSLRHPASLTKLMTLYMTFEALRDRRVSIDQDIPVSPHCASMSPTKLGLVPGTRVTVHQAILGIVTRSANDAACSLGELLGGNEQRFGQMMTLKARALGMRRTVFRNASGLPDPAQYSTARDMATLARRLIRDFPDQYHFFSTPEFVWHGQTIFNHDTMLKVYPGADGLKTGYINSSGHNLVTSAVRDHLRLIGVIFGAPSNGVRDQRMTAMLNQGFATADAVAAASEPRQPARQGRAAPQPVVSPHLVVPQPRGQEVAQAEPARPALRRETPPRRSAAARPRGGASWSISVGAFESKAFASRMAARARHLAADGDGEPRVEHVRVRGVPLWEALVGGFSEPEAAKACRALARHRIHCTPLHAEIGQIASR